MARTLVTEARIVIIIVCGSQSATRSALRSAQSSLRSSGDSHLCACALGCILCHHHLRIPCLCHRARRDSHAVCPCQPWRMMLMMSLGRWSGCKARVRVFAYLVKARSARAQPPLARASSMPGAYLQLTQSSTLCHHLCSTSIFTRDNSLTNNETKLIGEYLADHIITIRFRHCRVF